MNAVELNAGTTAVRDDARFDEAKLAAWLYATVPDLSGPMQVSQFKGGQSNPTYRLDVGGRAFVLRRKPVGVTTPGAQDELDRLVRRGMLEQLIEERGQMSVLQRDLVQLQVQHRTELDEAATEVHRANLQAEAAHHAIVELRETVDVLQGHVARLQEIREANEAKIEALRARLRAKRP